MKYKLHVTKVEDNPKFDPRDQYSREDKSIISECLSVEVNEEEFIAIKKAVIEVIK